MQRRGAEFEAHDLGQLNAQAVRIVHRVAVWADARAILSDVALYGGCLFDGTSSSPLNLAVRYDQSQMNEGFDDWIEQLRTDFAGLRTSVGQPLNVLTPDNGAAWIAVVDGIELTSTRDGKVRLISGKAVAPGQVRADLQNRWSWMPRKPTFAAHAYLQRRPLAPRAAR